MATKLHLALLFALGVIASGGLAPSARAQSSNGALPGPIDLRNQRGYNLLFYTFIPEDASVLPEGRSSFSADLAIANDMLIPPSSHGEIVQEDYETQRLALTYNRGLGHGLQVGAQLPIIDRDGGILDGVIEAYHGLLRVGQTQDVIGGRDSYPEYRAVWQLIRPDGTVEVNQGAAFGLGDASAEIKQDLPLPGRLHAALRAGIKAPTGDESDFLGSGAVDEGLDADFDYAASYRFGFFGDVSQIWMGKDNDLPEAARTNTLTLWGFQYRLSKRDSLVAQTDNSDVVLKTGNIHADTTPETGSLAFRRTFPGGIWTVALSENGDIFNYRAPYLAGIGPDFTVFAGVTWINH